MGSERQPVAATIAAVRSALESAGSIGVIASDEVAPGLGEALRAAGVEAGGPETLGARVTVVPVSAAKGLEYDHVVVVEPAAIVRAEARGLNRLYVAITRAVSSLRIVHREPLPPALRRAGPGMSAGSGR
ncbi:hypothetical protein DY218_23735 [Streptomyces triticagri]|uniref:UvrD-like helicase C-terminal domain-containing protein n=1 Tax=Streptomyces triticagri TaxID=2293568 RepID=A0A372LZY5_9ACTN|nr:hypothetical protein DY218_23735 [Streptomyces triticagri]